MNKANILKLAAYIESLPPGKYDQRISWKPCGSPSCIAGHATFLAGQKIPIGLQRERSTCEAASKWLGIKEPESSALFTEEPYYGDGNRTPTPQDAAWTLRHLAETSSVVWRPKGKPQRQPISHDQG